MTYPVAFCDTETTGLHPELHEIYEVGLILPVGTEHHWWLPVDLADADPFALQIGGFHERHPHGYSFKPYGQVESGARMVDHGVMDPAMFALQFSFLTFGLHLAGAVVSFDADRLGRLLRRHGRSPDWHYHLIDVEALAVGFLAGRLIHGDEPYMPPWSSDELTAALGLDPVPEDERHTALGDCRWARAIYQKVFGQ